MRILFVCLGNICRSPLAEAIFKSKIVQKGLDTKVFTDSCGTSNYHIGDTPDPRTLRNAMKNGIEIQHVGRQIHESDLTSFDIIFAMDKSNYENILKLKNATTYKSKVKLLREFDPVKGHEVPDPYFGEEQGFQDVFEMLDRSLDHFINQLERQQLLNQ